MAKSSRNISSWNGFTLIELMVVVVILGIAASVLVVSTIPSREYKYDKIAVANLRTIAQANKLYSTRYGFYYPWPTMVVNNLALINANLSIDIPSFGWNYTIEVPLGANGNDFRVNATRRNRRLSIRDTMIVTCTNLVAGACYETNFANL